MIALNEQLVSIIMPAYNSEAYIGESIQSLIEQTYENWELIVVDDLSTDKTVEIIEKYQDIDCRIKLLKNSKNLGGAGARNRAIASANGRYIAFLDSDDIWLPHKLSSQLKEMQDNQRDFVFSSYYLIDDNSNFIGEVLAPEYVTYSMLLKHNFIGCLTAIYDAGKLGKIFMPLVRKRQDFALWLQLLKRTDKAYGISEPLACYRIRAGSLSDNKKEALIYYWRVLRDVEKLSLLRSLYSISCYLLIVGIKKKLPAMYNFFFIKTIQ